MNEKLLFSRKQAADMLSVSLRSIDYLLERGELRGRKVGKRTLIPRAVLEKFARGTETIPSRADGE